MKVGDHDLPPHLAGEDVDLVFDVQQLRLELTDEVL